MLTIKKIRLIVSPGKHVLSDCRAWFIQTIFVLVENGRTVIVMLDFELTVELTMSKIPDSEDLRNYILACAEDYQKKHPQENVVLTNMHFSFANRTLEHLDRDGIWYLPKVVKKVPVKRVRILRRA